MTEMILTSQDNLDLGDPTHLRLVCCIRGGGKLAVWGSTENRKNIDDVLGWIRDEGFPLKITSDSTPANEPWASEFQHTHWLPQTHIIRRLR